MHLAQPINDFTHAIWLGTIKFNSRDRIKDRRSFAGAGVAFMFYSNTSKNGAVNKAIISKKKIAQTVNQYCCM